MSEFDDMSDRDERVREPKDGEYSIPSLRAGEVVGLIVCIRPGLRLIDFYRTSDVLAKDCVVVSPKTRDSASGSNVEIVVTPPTPQNMKGGQA